MLIISQANEITHSNKKYAKVTCLKCHNIYNNDHCCALANLKFNFKGESNQNLALLVFQNVLLINNKNLLLLFFYIHMNIKQTRSLRET